MAAQKVTITMDSEDLARARAEAEREGVSLSAWLARAARTQATRDAGRQYERWLADNPEIDAELRGWRQMTSATQAQRWAGLGEPA